jgi:hypothetical protein
MSQDGSHGQQGTDDSSDNGSAPPATTDTATSPSRGESSNSGSWTGLPVAEDAGRGKEPAPAGSSLSKGKSPAAEVAAATSDDNVSKGKRKVGAHDSMGGGGGRRNLLPHKLIERERRKRMNILYGELQALLPDIPEKKVSLSNSNNRITAHLVVCSVKSVSYYGCIGSLATVVWCDCVV